LYPEAYMRLYAEWAKLSNFIEKKINKIDPKFKVYSNPGKKSIYTYITLYILYIKYYKKLNIINK